ncbi:MAG: alpha/beta fold hydrolase [Spirochaetes bacterium]|nr:alpha/beta fold hydrolase [Spirochaetota bacterium]
MRKDISFYSEGKKLAGHLYIPDNAAGPCKTVVLCHGFAGIKEILLPGYAEAYAKEGYASLVFDYRGFGESEGDRGRLVPAEQVADIRNAITYIRTCPEVSRDHIALWGSSFGAANAIHAAAVDERVQCVVAQITYASGERMVLGGQDAAGRAKVLSTIEKVWERAVTTNKVMALTPDQILTDDDSKTFYGNAMKQYPLLAVKIPLFTLKHIIEYKPEDAIRRVRVPVCIIGAENDIVCPVSETHALFAAANEPKEMSIIPKARHFSVYEGEHLAASSGTALAWFNRYC